VLEPIEVKQQNGASMAWDYLMPREHMILSHWEVRENHYLWSKEKRGQAKIT